MKKSKTSQKWLLIVLGVVVIAFAATTIFFLAPILSGQGSYAKSGSSDGDQTAQNSIDATSSIETAQAKLGLPIRLKIPEINVDATIENVGLTPEGAMGVPSGPANTAWFDLGPRPGENGSAVIAGHEGWKDGIPAVFDDLHALQKGDEVYVQDGQGTTVTFVVRAIRTYGENDNASDVFASNGSTAHLNLITCEGTWNSVRKSYSDRLVVFTDEVD